MYLGDFQIGALVDFEYTHVAANGTPTSFSDTPDIAIYWGDDPANIITAGITFDLDFDSYAGRHHVQIDTSATGFLIWEDYRVVITAGTVDGIPVAGYVIAHFSIENRPAPGVIRGLAMSGTLSSTQASTDVFGIADGGLAGRRLVWHSTAAPAHQAAIIQDNASGLLTFTAIPTTPVAGDPFIIV